MHWIHKGCKLMLWAILLVWFSGGTALAARGWHGSGGRRILQRQGTLCGPNEYMKRSNECMECDPNCRSGACEDFLGCTVCVSPFFTSQIDLEWPFTCTECTVPGCSICDEKQLEGTIYTCNECNEGLLLSENRTLCLEEISEDPSTGDPFGTIEEQSIATSESSPSETAACGAGFILRQIDLVCELCDVRCIDGSCEDYTGCRLCQEGFFTSRRDSLYPFKCRLCDVPNCKECEQGIIDGLPPICVQCQRGFYSIDGGLQCIQDPSFAESLDETRMVLESAPAPQGAVYAAPSKGCSDEEWFGDDGKCHPCNQNCPPPNGSGSSNSRNNQVLRESMTANQSRSEVIAEGGSAASVTTTYTVTNTTAETQLTGSSTSGRNQTSEGLASGLASTTNGYQTKTGSNLTSQGAVAEVSSNQGAGQASPSRFSFVTGVDRAAQGPASEFSYVSSSNRTTQSSASGFSDVPGEDQAAQSSASGFSSTSGLEQAAQEPASGFPSTSGAEQTAQEPASGISSTSEAEQAAQEPASGFLSTSGADQAAQDPASGISSASEAEQAAQEPTSGISSTSEAQQAAQDPASGISSTSEAEQGAQDPASGISSASEAEQAAQDPASGISPASEAEQGAQEPASGFSPAPGAEQAAQKPASGFSPVPGADQVAQEPASGFSHITGADQASNASTTTFSYIKDAGQPNNGTTRTFSSVSETIRISQGPATNSSYSESRTSTYKSSRVSSGTISSGTKAASEVRTVKQIWQSCPIMEDVAGCEIDKECTACGVACAPGHCFSYIGCIRCEHGYSVVRHPGSITLGCTPCNIPNCEQCVDGAWDISPQICAKCGVGFQLTSGKGVCEARKTIYYPYALPPAQASVDEDDWEDELEEEWDE